MIQISGHEGGTGASPLSSIKNAGTPWELGLAETQRALVENELRDRVVLRADGGMRSGRDIVIAAMLGAEEYGFGTIAMVATGCVMARQCHLNTCPVGVATQDPALRAKYPGTPEMVVNFMLGVANEVRAILANLGHRSLNDIIGRPELLQPIDGGEYPKAAMLNLDEILAPADPTGTQPRYHLQERNDREDNRLIIRFWKMLRKRSHKKHQFDFLILFKIRIEQWVRGYLVKLRSAMAMLGCLIEQFSATLKGVLGRVLVPSVLAAYNSC